MAYNPTLLQDGDFDNVTKVYMNIDANYTRKLIIF